VKLQHTVDSGNQKAAADEAEKEIMDFFKAAQYPLLKLASVLIRMI